MNFSSEDMIVKADDLTLNLIYNALVETIRGEICQSNQTFTHTIDLVSLSLSFFSNSDWHLVLLASSRPVKLCNVIEEKTTVSKSVPNPYSRIQ